jgi:carbon storage regulator
MLVLTRKAGEKLRIGNSIIMTLLQVRQREIRIGIDAPARIPIRRHGPDENAATPTARPSRTAASHGK